MSTRTDQSKISQQAFNQARKEGHSIFESGRIAVEAVQKWIAENKIKFPLDIMFY